MIHRRRCDRNESRDRQAAATSPVGTAWVRSATEREFFRAGSGRSLAVAALDAEMTTFSLSEECR